MTTNHRPRQDHRRTARLRVEWLAETQLIDQCYQTSGGQALPKALREELAKIKLRLRNQ